MLSRVADNLYWMSRYLERAEHAARLLDVNLNLMLDESASSADRRWRRVLGALGNPPNLAWSGDAYQVAQILTFDHFMDQKAQMPLRQLIPHTTG